MAEEKLKQINIRMPEEQYYRMKKVILHLRTDMTAFVNELVEKEVSKVYEWNRWVEKERTQS